MGLLDGQRAIVTGGASGIGRATCERMTAEGARVAVFDVDGDGAEGVAGEIDGVAYQVDVTDFHALDAAVGDAAERLGGISALFNNAGGSNLSRIHEFDLGEWERLVRLNLTAVFHGMKATIPRVLADGGGSVVSTASVSGTRPSGGESPYSAAKAAVVALTANAALEYAPTVRVNSVSPGMIRTGLTDLLLGFDGMVELMEAKTPLGRVGSGSPETSPTSWFSSARTSPGS